MQRFVKLFVDGITDEVIESEGLPRDFDESLIGMKETTALNFLGERGFTKWGDPLSNQKIYGISGCTVIRLVKDEGD